MANKKLITQAGQTLIEVLVTALLIALAAIALIRFQNYLNYSNLLTQQKADALTLALQKIENLRDFQVINNTTGYTAYLDIASGNTTTILGNTSYNLVWTISNFSNPNYKTINLTVSWVDKNAITQTVQLVTNVGRIDPANSAIIM